MADAAVSAWFAAYHADIVDWLENDEPTFERVYTMNHPVGTVLTRSAASLGLPAVETSAFAVVLVALDKPAFFVYTAFPDLP
jgi:hypothetical protein